MTIKKQPTGMYVVKRDGRREAVHLDKITSRIQKLCYGLNMEYIDPVSITLSVINGLYAGVSTVQLDMLSAEIAASKIGDHPDFGILAARLAVSNLHKETKKQFSDVVDILHKRTNKEGRRSPLVSERHHAIVMKNADKLNSCIIYDRDFLYSYFGFKKLEESYLMRVDGKIVERPQHLLMRVAVGIHGEDVDAAVETYNLLSEHYYLHCAPTLLLAATPRPQLAASFSLMMPDDSMDGIMACLTQCASITKASGNIGVNVHNIRAKGSYIAGTNGISNGLQPMLRVFNNLANFVDQEGNRRSGTIAVYLEPWHLDVRDFLNLKKAVGKAEVLANDLSYALWIPDLFMRRVNENGAWSLMCPRECPGLSDCWGEEFEGLYERYEKEGKYRKQIQARDLWRDIIVSQMKNGSPALLYKDACNRKSNQKHLGAIKGGSFAAEAAQFTSPGEIAVCNGASVALPAFVKPGRGATFDFDKLKSVVKSVARSLDRAIDAASYPERAAEASSRKHRPIAVSALGLADVFAALEMSYDGDEARLLNRQIFETVYYGALEASVELAEKAGPHPSHAGSPASRGLLQHDLWDVEPTPLWDWAGLKARIAESGVRNSLLVAVGLDEDAAEILNCSGSFEPYVSNVSVRRVSAKSFSFVNGRLVKDLLERDLWDESLKNEIVAAAGCLQDIPAIPEDLKRVYKTVWDVSNKTVLDMAADRGAFIDQSQSLRLYVSSKFLNAGSVNSMLFHGWKRGLKTGVCVVHKQQDVSNAPTNFKAKYAVASPIKNGGEKVEENAVCLLGGGGSDCDMCSA